MKLHKKSVLATLGAVCVMGLTAPHAQAGVITGPNGFSTGLCSGKWIDGGKVGSTKTGYHRTARWDLYYSTANGGSNCLIVHDMTAGKHYMEAMIRPAYVFHDGAKDTGTYNNYAGGVGLRHAAGKCIGITVSIRDNGHTYSRNVDKFHCG